MQSACQSIELREQVSLDYDYKGLTSHPQGVRRQRAKNMTWIWGQRPS
jgi:hypothetical protein